jgi:protein tyrosine/serine phosphatase
VTKFDLSTRAGRFRAHLDANLGDHAFLRVGFQNAHWITPEMVRTNQPWPFQLRWWAEQGIKTVLNLRGGGYETGFYVLEREACARLGLTLIDVPLGSREVPSRARVERARELFESIEYPALMHCKSGADRAGLMATLYRHFRLGEPISEAMGKELTLRTLHMRQGKTGVLDHAFDHYVRKVEPMGISYIDWVRSDAYDPAALKAEFQAGWWGTLLSDRLLKRE